MRKRIKTDRDYILLLSKIYEVSFYIAQKFYNKANRVLEQAKFFLKMYNFQLQMV